MKKKNGSTNKPDPDEISVNTPNKFVPAEYTSDGSVYDEMSMIESLCEGYVEQYRKGQALPLELFADKYPALRAKILEVLPTILMMEKVRGQSLGKRKDGRVESDPNQTPNLGDFQIVREIGRGGMGIVYEALQISLDRKVALKVLPSHLLNDKQIQQFHREASTAAKLHHTNIAPVYGVNKQGQTHYFAMQLLEGETLDSGLKSGKKFSASQVISIGEQVVSALEYAHDHGVFHRDIKPSNLILDNNNNVWVTDFGLAISRENMTSESGVKTSGTLRYMPPESLSGLTHGDDAKSEIVPRTDAIGDIYALGITMIELLSGRPAFDTSSPGTLTDSIKAGKIELLERPAKSMPSDLIAVLKKAVNPDPHERYQFAREFRSDLQALSAGHAVSAVPFSILGNVWRWSKRNSALATVSAIAAFLLYAISMIASLSHYQIDRSLKSEQRARQQAEKTSRLASRTLDKIFDDFSSSGEFTEYLETDIPATKASQESALMLKELAGFYGQLASEAEGEVKIQVKAVLSRARVAAIHERLGEYDKAVTTYHKIQRIYSSLVSEGKLGSLAETDLKIAQIKNKLGRVLKYAGKIESANNEHRQAIELLNKSIDKFGHNEPELLFELAHSYYLLGKTLRPGFGPNSLPPVAGAPDSSGSFPDDDSSQHLLKAIELLYQIRFGSSATPDPKLADACMYLRALCNRELADDQWDRRTEDDKKRHRSAVSDLRRLSIQKPSTANIRFQLVKTMAELDVFKIGSDLEILSEAKESLLEAIAFGRKLVDQHPDVTPFRLELVHACFKLAIVEGRIAETLDGEPKSLLLQQQESHFRQAQEEQSFLARRHPHSIGYKVWLARFCLSLADCQTLDQKPSVRSEHVEHAVNLLFGLPAKEKKRVEIAALIQEARSMSVKSMIKND
jgi:serine/threonine protein kinase